MGAGKLQQKSRSWPHPPQWTFFPCPFTTCLIVSLAKYRVPFNQKQFFGGIYLHKKCLGTSRALMLFFLMAIPLCLNAPDFQPSIKNCRPGCPWGWLSKLFYIISVPTVFFPRPLICTVLVTFYVLCFLLKNLRPPLWLQTHKTGKYLYHW